MGGYPLVQNKRSIKGFARLTGAWGGVMKNTTKGFTLIELLVVVLIIGILSSIALPQYTKTVEKSRALEGKMYAETWIKGQQLYHMANGTFANASNMSNMDISLPETLKDFTITTNSANSDSAYLTLERKSPSPVGTYWLIVSVNKPGLTVDGATRDIFYVTRASAGYFCRTLGNNKDCVHSYRGGDGDEPWCCYD